MRFSAVAVCTLVGLAFASPLYAQQENILDVGTQSQLLLDTRLVYQSEGISFAPEQARKHPDNPLITADQPCEGSFVSMFAGTVLYNPDLKLFQMWYTGPGNEAYFDGTYSGIFYATSKDGLKWDKPALQNTKAKNGQPHNWVLPLHCPSVFYDPEDNDENRRYKMICFDVDRGYLALISPDGLRWAHQSQETIVPVSYVDDVISAFFDRRTKRYVSLLKMSSPVFGRVRRTTYSSSSRDFREWTPLQTAFKADKQDDWGSLARLQQVRPLLHYPDNMNVVRTEFYGSGAYSAESCVVGFPWVFTISTNVPKPGNQDGPIEVQVAVTRDLETWHRPFRTPIIPLGKPGSWDGGMILTGSQAIDVGDEVWMYYGGTNHTHGAPPSEKHARSIGLAIWKKDRFAAAKGSGEGGTLLTVPMQFTGDRLELNAQTAEQGEVRVELLDAGGQPLPGFGLSEPIQGDKLNHFARFPGHKDLSTLRGQPISIRIHLKNAKLFAFAFRKVPK